MAMAGAIDTSAGTLTVQNSTIVGNSSKTGKGGGIHRGGSFGTHYVTSSIVTNNTAVQYPDLRIPGTFHLAFSAIGKDSVTPSTQVNNRPYGEDPRLGPLANYGGLTKVFSLLPDSPLLDHGSNPANLTTDQRGTGYARSVGTSSDIGAFEALFTPPTAKTSVSDISTSGGSIYAITVTYADDLALDVSTLNTGDLRITGPIGFDVLPAFVKVDDLSNGSPRVAVYQFTPPGGTWDQEDYGTYEVHLLGGQVVDSTGSGNVPTMLASFNVRIASSFIVTNTNDSGTGSLRSFIGLANSRAGTSDTITFDPIVFGSNATIGLTSGHLESTDSLTVFGPGSSLLTITGNDQQRIFYTENNPGKSLTLQDMTLTKGWAGGPGDPDTRGGLVLVEDTVFTARRVIMTASKANNSGGALYVGNISYGSTYLDECLFYANLAGLSGTSALRASGALIVMCSRRLILTKPLMEAVAWSLVDHLKLLIQLFPIIGPKAGEV